MTEDEMVGWHHRLNGHEFEQTPGDGEGQGSLVCCSLGGRKEFGTTEPLNNNKETDKGSLYFCKLSNNIICSRRIYIFQEIIVKEFQ